MIIQHISQRKTKPFLKWAGGKTQLLSTIDFYLPEDFARQDNINYIEPFVGGGAVLFYLLRRYDNIRRAVINDINPRLATAYSVVRNQPQALIDALSRIQREYRGLSDYDLQKSFYLSMRSRFNSCEFDSVEEVACLIFMNRTCFNGLYRENSKGGFNVPFGRYINPIICDEDVIRADSEVLQRVEVLNGDFTVIEPYIDGYTFVYFDPPYRPLDSTSSFNSYVKETFNDAEQVRLKDFYARLSDRGCHVMLSNSDGRGRNSTDTFFDILYKDFFIERVYAKRSINANPSKRGLLTELLIRNYPSYQGKPAKISNVI